MLNNIINIPIYLLMEAILPRALGTVAYGVYGYATGMFQYLVNLLDGGTSLNVYPAAGLLHYYRGGRLAVVNLSETPMDHQADLVIHAPIDEVLAQVCRRLFG